MTDPQLAVAMYRAGIIDRDQALALWRELAAILAEPVMGVPGGRPVSPPAELAAG